MLTYITSGESHGKCLIGMLEGFPSGLNIDIDEIDSKLAARQKGYGRGGRMAIETDTVDITSGVVKGKTTGAPIGMIVKNSDFKINEMPELYRPRPGHADLVGALKYDQGIRAVLERASARETAARVAVGAVCSQLLSLFGIEIISHVVRIGSVSVDTKGLDFKAIKKKLAVSELKVVSKDAEKKMISEIKKHGQNGDTVGGEIEILVSGLPMGLGSYVHYKNKIDAKLAAAMISIQAVKAVEFGAGKQYGSLPGSKLHDEISYSKAKGYFHKTNNAGGIEGGMTNGNDLVLRTTMKPIATLKSALKSVNMKTKKRETANFERSDICAVTACSVVAEMAVAFELADSFLQKFGGDSVKEIKRNYNGYIKQIQG